MIHSLPDFPPLFPDGKWWKLRLASMLDGASREESIVFANRERGLKPREWMRFRIVDRKDTEVLLSLPMVHGASALKNHKPDSWRVVDDKTHLRKLDATVSTLYGHTPYFSLVWPGFGFVDVATETSRDVCLKMDGIVCHLLGLDSPSLVNSLRNADMSEEKYASIVENMVRFREDLSIVDGLFRYGPEIIFRLIPTL